MKYCPNCGRELEEGAKFCPDCGAALKPDPAAETAPAAPEGETAASPAEKAAPAQEAPMENTAPEQAAPTAAPAGKKKRRLPLVIAGIAVVAAAAAAVALMPHGGSAANADYGLYVRDRELVYNDFKSGAVELTERLDEDSVLGDGDLTGQADDISEYITFSDNGKRVFYPDRLSDSDDGVSIYYRDLGKKDGEGVKVDSDVRAYAINAAGTEIVYLKGEDQILYRSDLSDREKLASGVTGFAAANDCKTVAYLNDEGSYYIWRDGKDTVKLAGNIDSVRYVKDDLTTIYYMKDDSLYLQSEGADRVKIAGDVSWVKAIYDTGEVYYTTAEEVELPLMDFVTDDMAAADADIMEPEKPDYPDYPDYPYWWNYDSDAAYDDAYAQYQQALEDYQTESDRLKEEYNAAYAKYKDKRSRDRLREKLKDATISDTVYSLYYYDGEAATLVSDQLADEWYMDCTQDTAEVLFSVREDSGVKVKLSEVGNAADVENAVDDAREEAVSWRLAVGAAVTDAAALGVEDLDIDSIGGISADGAMIYFVADVSEEKYEGDLYRITVSKGVPAAPEQVDTDVYAYNISAMEDKSLVYYKNMKDGKGDLYVDGQEMDYDVRASGVLYVEDGKVLYYYTDWNYDKDYGTLKQWKNGEKTTVADDIHDYQFLGNGDILYLYDFSTNHYNGTL